MPVCRKYSFVIVCVILIASLNVTSDRATAVCNAILVTEIFCYRYSTINNFAKNNIFQLNLVINSLQQFIVD